MTVGSETSEFSYIGDGATVNFAFSNTVYESSSLKVELVDTSGASTVVSTSQYTVALAADYSSATVAMLTAPAGDGTAANSEKLVISRNEPFTQAIDYIDGDEFPAETHERGLDRSVIRDQQLKERQDNSFELTAAQVAAGVTPAIPSAALAYVRWNATGTDLETVSELPDIPIGSSVATYTNVANLKAVSSATELVVGMVVVTRGYFSIGDGGTAVYAIVAGGTGTDDGGEFHDIANGTQARLIKPLDTVSVKIFGAKGDDSNDDTAEIQGCLDYAGNNGATVYIPSGTYKLSDELQITVNASKVRGDGFASVLKQYTNNKAVLRVASKENQLDALKFTQDSGVTGCTGIRIAPVDETQTTTLTDTNYNKIRNFTVVGCTTGVALIPGPDVGGADSQCFYNQLDNFEISGCTTGLYITEGPNASAAPANRNKFTNGRVGDTGTNIGVYVEAGDTCRFVSVDFEGIQTGSTPTAIKVDNQSPLGYDNNNNAFIGCRIEACTNHVVNANPRTIFLDTNFDGTASTFTNLPLYCLAGEDTSRTFQVTPGYFHQTNNQVAGWSNQGVTIRTPHFDGDGTDSYEWQDYAVTTSNTARISAVGESQSKFTKVNGMVFWHMRIQFTGAAGNGGSFDVELPVEPETNLYRLFSSISPHRLPCTVLDGTTLEQNFAVFCNHTQTLNGNSYLTISHSSGLFNTGGNNNSAYLFLTYHAA